MNLERYENCSVRSLGSEYSMATVSSCLLSDPAAVLSPLVGDDDYNQDCNKLDLGMILHSPVSPSNSRVGRSRKLCIVGLHHFGRSDAAIDEVVKRRKNPYSSSYNSHRAIQSSSQVMDRITPSISDSIAAASITTSAALDSNDSGIEGLLSDLETLRKRNRELARKRNIRRKLT